MSGRLHKVAANAPAATILVGLMAGGVFVSEGWDCSLGWHLWAILHEGRSDYAQFLCTMFQLIVGAGLGLLTYFGYEGEHKKNYSYILEIDRLPVSSKPE